MSDGALTAVEVRAPRGSEQTEIVWADGTSTAVANELLRGYCPCAGCQGHSGTIAFRSGGNPEIDEITEVGNYALCFRWADGHDSGIYTWPYLRRLGEHAARSGREGVIPR